jgi:NADH-quinone oxidoreductase subunit N
MLSLGGLPLTGGFIGKWFLFGGLLERYRVEPKSWYVWLAIWAILNTVVSFFYYFRFIRSMYLDDETADERPLALSAPLRVALAAAVVGILFIGVYPQPFIRMARTVVTALTRVGPPVAAG